jgi:hypothetical protein
MVVMAHCIPGCRRPVPKGFKPIMKNVWEDLKGLSDKARVTLHVKSQFMESKGSVSNGSCETGLSLTWKVKWKSTAADETAHTLEVVSRSRSLQLASRRKRTSGFPPPPGSEARSAAETAIYRPPASASSYASKEATSEGPAIQATTGYSGTITDQNKSAKSSILQPSATVGPVSTGDPREAPIENEPSM